jgi:hypothetical protein
MKKKICHFGTDNSQLSCNIWMLLFYGRALGAAKSASIGLNHKDSINIKIRRV